MRRALVVGAGFEGLASAFYLADSYGCDVTILDAAPRLGGVMQGMRHDAFHLDFGCQVFDNFDPRVSNAILTLADNKCQMDTISYASRFAGIISDRVSVPDLTGLPTGMLAAIQRETIESGQDGLDAETLSDYYAARWGKTAATHLDRINIKALDESADKLDQSSRIYAGLARVRMFEDDAHALKLKAQDARLDAKIAVPRAVSQFYSEAQSGLTDQNIIPVPDSLGGFCASAGDALEKRGVDLRLGSEIQGVSVDEMSGKVTVSVVQGKRQTDFEADLLVWCGSFERLCASLKVACDTERYLDPIGTTLTYFFAPKDSISPIGYLQNYDADMRFFRWSSMGTYTRQVSEDGMTFCCVETPSKENRDRDDPQSEALRDWNDLKALGLVSGEPSAPALRRFVPNVIKRRKPGYTSAALSAQRTIDLQFGMSIVYQTADSFGRTPTARQLYDKIDGLLS